MRTEQEAELRRRINENLKNIRSGKYRREADAKRKEKRTELEKAFAWEIELGHDVLTRREYSKIFNRLMAKKELSREDELYAEELQGWIDKLDQQLDGYTRAELMRFVRLWNKSRKVKYHAS